MHWTRQAPEDHLPRLAVRWQACWLTRRSRVDLPCAWIGLGCLLAGLTRSVVGLIAGAPFQPGLDTLSAAAGFVLAVSIRIIAAMRHSSAAFAKAGAPPSSSQSAGRSTTDAAILLTPREQDVLSLMAESDLTIKEIGLRLRLSPNTVRTHEHNIGEKLGAHRRWPIVEAARQQGLLGERTTWIEQSKPD